MRSVPQGQAKSRSKALPSDGTSGLNIPILGTSERSAFKRCPQRWWWAYREGLTPRLVQADAFWFGIGIHLALANWYKPGLQRSKIHPADVFDEWCGDEIAFAKTYFDDDYDDPVWEDAHELGVTMLDEYVKCWGTDSQWYVISPERPFSVSVARGGNPIATFASRWDLVVRNNEDGRLYLVEHKTASQILLAYLAIDDQAGAYWAVAEPILKADGLLDPDEELAGIIYNFLRKAMPDERPRNELGQALNQNGTVSKRQQSPLFVREMVERNRKERKTQMERLAAEVEWMEAMRNGEKPVLKFTTRDCPYCPFFDMCQLHERGGDTWKRIARTAYVVKDPYSEKRKSAA